MRQLIHDKIQNHCYDNFGIYPKGLLMNYNDFKILMDELNESANIELHYILHEGKYKGMKIYTSNDVKDSEIIVF